MRIFVSASSTRPSILITKPGVNLRIYLQQVWTEILHFQHWTDVAWSTGLLEQIQALLSQPSYLRLIMQPRKAHYLVPPPLFRIHS